MSGHFYAHIGGWSVHQLIAKDLETSIHIIGYIVDHERLSPDNERTGGTYIGSALKHLDFEAQVATNHRGRLIKLLGSPYPGALPHELEITKEWARRNWGLKSPYWTRLI